MVLYGVRVSVVEILSTLVITLATDGYGPVLDNDGGIMFAAFILNNPISII